MWQDRLADVGEMESELAVSRSNHLASHTGASTGTTARSQAPGKRPTNARQQRVKSRGLGWFRVKSKIHDPLQLLRIVPI